MRHFATFSPSTLPYVVPALQAVKLYVSAQVKLLIHFYCLCFSHKMALTNKLTHTRTEVLKLTF